MKSQILYIDDVKENLDSFKLSFWTNYDVLLAESQDEALRILETSKVKVLLIDQDILDGAKSAFVEEIRKNYSCTLLVILAAFVNLDMALNAINIGAFQLIQKPWEEKEILQVLRNAIKQYDLNKENSDLVNALKTKTKELEASNNELLQVTKELTESKAEVEEKEKLLMNIFRRLPLIMLLVDSEKKIVKINNKGVDISGKAVDDIVGTGGGDALNCITALSSPGGCGSAHICKKCSIRNTVTDTLENKKDHHKVKAQLSMVVGDRISERQILISTAYMEGKSPTVLVTIEDITETENSLNADEKIYTAKTKLDGNN